jgi:hypothetical protein
MRSHNQVQERHADNVKTGGSSPPRRAHAGVANDGLQGDGTEFDSLDADHGGWSRKLSGLLVKQSKPGRYRSATPSVQRSTVVVRLLHTKLVASSNLAAATRIHAFAPASVPYDGLTLIT